MFTPVITAIAISIGSYHIHKDPNKEYHEINPGVILEVNDVYVAGLYRNSFGRNTFLLGRSFGIAQVGPVGLGAIIAGCTGYHSPVCGAFSVRWGYASAIFTPPIGEHAAAIGFAIRIPIERTPVSH
jgi:hypothetical protein